MSAKKGGPAFPVPRPDMTIHGQTIEETQGMTLRDYFAAKAMQGFAADSSMVGVASGTIAEFAYVWADAMLVEREKGGEA